MLGELAGILNKHRATIMLAVFSGLMILAWQHRFVQDDAYISFRYADHLVHGEGLVWNPGERVEGYTNFFWTLLLASFMALGADPVLSSQVLGMLFFGISLVFTFKLSRLVFPSDMMSLLVVLLLGTHYTFSCFATGGLETQMQTALFAAGLYVCVQGIQEDDMSLRRISLLATLVTIALLTRMDSVLVCAVIASAAAYHILKHRKVLPGAPLRVALLAGIPALTVGVWFLWKLSYYGSILPNPFYVKASSASSMARGVHYLWLYSVSYFLLPFPVLGLLALWRGRGTHRTPLAIMLAAVTVWLLYIIKIGGDFMEFRFLVPVMPFLFILICWVTFALIPWRGVQALAVLLVLAGDVHHTATFAYNRQDAVEAITELEAHLFGSNQNWAGIGHTLGTVFKNLKNVTIATTAAGAIPFYSGLPAVDMLGINDPRVAREGYFIGSIPGHQRISSMKYLLERNVNLVISHPLVLKSSAPVTQLPLLPRDPLDNLNEVKVLEIPLDSEHKFLALYLSPCPAVDSIILRNVWITHSFALHSWGKEKGPPQK
jgi:arabinofuranosyltransferase